ncbi:DUF1127 domain-containing protein [Aquamicrobium sp. LC103]|uniref:DUF1127 domain-containing protein n=1 Tax=Aquamicrobium sp. LC103 TaxID=1120658 RepID=UPI00063EC6C2|nr:DUF1127 domain-containing protein [Aquamicrobium sp. LC103]
MHAVRPRRPFAGSLAPASPWQRVRRAFARPMRLYDRHLQRRHLADLDDHLLRDIGVTPEQRRAECSRPFWR